MIQGDDGGQVSSSRGRGPSLTGLSPCHSEACGDGHQRHHAKSQKIGLKEGTIQHRTVPRWILSSYAALTSGI